MNNILNKSSIEQSLDIGKKFVQNMPFKHVVIEDFFTSDFCQKLLEEFPSFDEKLAMNENGDVGRKAVHEHISDLGSAYKKLDELVKNQDFISLIETYTGIKGLKYDPYYFGGGTHNNLEGQDLDPHVDFTHHPISGQHRRMNLIVYLNKEWEKEWGGNIELHKNPRLEPDQDEIVSVEPLFNRAVIFETNDISWHGFPRISLPDDKKSLSRKSFALYYYTDSREEKIKPHSTIYVERHLPERIQQGVKLSANDLQEIKTLLKRRDQHLERLYGYITSLTEETAGLKYLLQQSKLKNNKSKIVEASPVNQVENVNFDESRLLARIYDLENSTSWKLTSPLRKLVKFFKRK
jgi:hypothetical protein